MITKTTIEKAMVIIKGYREIYTDPEDRIDIWDMIEGEDYDLNTWSDDGYFFGTLYDILPDGRTDFQSFTQIYKEKIN